MTAKEKLLRRLKERSQELREAQKAAERLQQLIGSLNECYAILKEEYDVPEKELQEILNAAD